MKIDPKYFNTFLIIAALVAALIIAFFTISNFSGRQADFRERVTGADSLQYEYFAMLEESDSLQVSEITSGSRYVILDFWAPWNSGAADIHQNLAKLRWEKPGSVEIVSVVVRDREEDASSFVRQHPNPFLYVRGDRFFNRYNLPGLPLRIVLSPQGVVEKVFFGPIDSVQFDSLRSIIQN